MRNKSLRAQRAQEVMPRGGHEKVGTAWALGTERLSP
jgi:hypothetical protein